MIVRPSNESDTIQRALPSVNMSHNELYLR